MSTLIEKALRVKVDRRRELRWDKQETDLAVAWARGTVTTKQVSVVVRQKNQTAALLWLLKRLKQVVADNYKAGIS